MEIPTPNQPQQTKRSNMTVILVVVVAILLFSAGIVILDKQKTETKNASQTASFSLIPTLPKEVMISVTSTGFSPQIVTIQIGSVVRWKNDSNDKATVNSDDYPTNQKFKELNLGEFANGYTLMHIFSKSGTYTYHDQFHPTHKGTIIVK